MPVITSTPLDVRASATGIGGGFVFTNNVTADVAGTLVSEPLNTSINFTNNIIGGAAGTLVPIFTGSPLPTSIEFTNTGIGGVSGTLLSDPLNSTISFTNNTEGLLFYNTGTDDFTGANGETVISRSLWTSEGGVIGVGLITGSAQISNNAWVCINDNQAVLIEANDDKIVIEVDYSVAAAVDNRLGIVYKYVDSNNHGMVKLREPNQDIAITTYNGTQTEKTFTYPWVEGNTYRVMVVITPDYTPGKTVVDVYVNGSMAASWGDAVLPGYAGGTKFGLARYTGSSNTVFDNFKIGALGTAPAVVGDYPAIVLNDSPSAYWQLGELTGTTAVDQVNNNNGVYVGTPSLGVNRLVSNTPTTAVLFDNVDDYVDLNAVAALVSSMTVITVELWFKTLSVPATDKGNIFFSMHAASEVNIIRLGTAISGKIFVSIGTGSDMLYGSGYNDFNPHHFVLSITDTGDYNLYIDGNLLSAGNLGAVALSTTTAVSLAQEYDPGPVPSDYYDGILDEVAIYNYALTPTQISTHYSKGKPSTLYSDAIISSSPVAYWRLGEEIGTTANEEINGYNGTYNAVTLGVQGLLISDNNSAVDFPLTGSYMGLPVTPALQILGDLTLEAWIKPTSFASTQDARIISAGTPGETEDTNYIYALMLLEDSATNTGIYKVFHEYGLGTNEIIEGLTRFEPGKTYHLVQVRDSVTQEYILYVNGVITEILPYANPPTGGTSTKVYIANDELDFAFNGIIDEPAIYNYKLPVSDIENHYLLGAGKPAAQTYNSLVISTKPEAYFRFNEISGTTVYDSSSNKRNSTWQGTPTLGIDGLILNDTNKAVILDGTSSYFQAANSTIYDISTENFSIDVWIQTAQNTGAMVILDKRHDSNPNHGYLVGLNNGLPFMFLRDNNNATVQLDSLTNVADGKIHYIVFNYNRAGNAEIWIDGVLTDSLDITSVTVSISNNGIATVGYKSYAGSTISYFDGAMDELSISRPGVLLTQQTIHERYYHGMGYNLLVSDDFTGQNGDLAIDRPIWTNEEGIFLQTVTPGSAQILNNALVITNDNNTILSDVGSESVVIDVDFTPAVGAINRSSITVKYVDSSNHGSIQLREENQDITITSEESGTNEIIVSKSYAWVEGQTYHIAVRVDNRGNASLYIDGVLELSSDALVGNYLSSTLYGLARNSGSSSTTFDNFKVHDISSGISPYNNAVVNDLPISYWRLGESFGTSAIDETSANYGTYYNSIALDVNGLLEKDTNRAVSFDGVNDYVGVSSALPVGTTDFTLEIWLKATSFVSFQSLFWKTGVGLYLNNGVIDFYYGGSHLGNTTLTTGVVYYIAVVVSGGTATYYINGLFDGTAAAAPLLDFTVIGSSSANETFHGTLDEPAVYNYALTLHQVHQHYYEGTGYRFIGKDDFTGANGDLVINRPLWIQEGGVFGGTVIAGSAQISNNQLVFTSNANAILMEAGTKEVVIDVDFTPAVGAINRVSIIYKYANNFNHGSVQLREESFQDIRIVGETGGGSQSVYSDVAFTWVEGQTYHITVKFFYNDRVEVYVDGVLKASANNAVEAGFASSTKFGLSRNTGATATTLDNFSIWSILYPRWDEVNKGALAVLFNGNLSVTNADSASTYGSGLGLSEMARSFGKWYWETKVEYTSTNSTAGCGIARINFDYTSWIGSDDNAIGIWIQDGSGIWRNATNLGTLGGTQPSGTVIGHKLDLDNKTYEVTVDGVNYIKADGGTDLSGTWYPAYTTVNTNDIITLKTTRTDLVYDIPKGYRVIYV